MKVDAKWSDYEYKTPPTYSEECEREFLEVSDAKDGSLFRDWEIKYAKEFHSRRDVQLDNCSNFAFLLKYLGGKHAEHAKKSLGTYIGQNGFFHWDGKYSCNYDKATQMLEKRTLEQANRDVYASKII